MRACVITIGCRLNQAEGDALRMALKDEGNEVITWGQGDRLNPALEHSLDIVIVNTCAVTEQAVRTSKKWIRRIAGLQPKPRLVVTGCLAEIEFEQLQNESGVDEVITQTQKVKLIEDCPILPSRSRAFLKIQDGCWNRCAYCLPAQIRGDPVSKPISMVEKEIRDLLAKGFKEIVLVGLNLGAYGLDLGTSLFALLVKLAQIDGDFRIRLGCLEPDSFPKAILERFSELRLCPHLHIPLQSGDDKILNLMQRKYSVAQYQALLERIVSHIPEVNIGTDLVVGFPGEDEASFNRTFDLISKLPFGYLHIFPYSPRPQTPAYSRPETVNQKEKKKRVNLLRSLSREKSLKFRSRFLGQVRDALLELPEAKRGLLQAMTDNYIRIFIPPPKESIWQADDTGLSLFQHQRVKVLITEVRRDKTFGKLERFFTAELGGLTVSRDRERSTNNGEREKLGMPNLAIG
uniref:MiaB/RimO family radical SAM methylthiotransferase n=1 Tax=candidate division WOR-3 bacterium TaxID=2052148 RepID=A0A7C6EDR9_UNCW3